MERWLGMRTEPAVYVVINADGETTIAKSDRIAVRISLVRLTSPQRSVKEQRVSDVWEWGRDLTGSEKEMVVVEEEGVAISEVSDLCQSTINVTWPVKGCCHKRDPTGAQFGRPYYPISKSCCFLVPRRYLVYTPGSTSSLLGAALLNQWVRFVIAIKSTLPAP